MIIRRMLHPDPPEGGGGVEEPAKLDPPAVDPPAMDPPVGFKEVSPEDVAAAMAAKNKDLKSTDTTIKPDEKPGAGDGTPIIPKVESGNLAKPDQNEIKLSKEALKGIFGDTDPTDQLILERLKAPPTVQVAGLSDEDKELIEKGKLLKGRADLENLMRYANVPGADLKHYANVMSLDVKTMDPLSKILAYRQINKPGAAPEDLRLSALEEFMQFPDEDYADISENRLKSLKASAKIKMEEEAATAESGILEYQKNIHIAPGKQEADAKAAQTLETRKVNEAAFTAQIPVLTKDAKISYDVPFKLKDGVDRKLDFAFNLDKPEQVKELNDFATSFVNNMLEINPAWGATPENVELVKQVAIQNYFSKHQGEIMQAFLNEALGEFDFTYAKKHVNPDKKIDANPDAEVVNTGWQVSEGPGA